MKQLKAIASKPPVKYTLTSDFNRLNDLYTSIRDDACRGMGDIFRKRSPNRLSAEKAWYISGLGGRMEGLVIPRHESMRAFVSRLAQLVMKDGFKLHKPRSCKVS